jgi:RHS repeat-associated protein
MIIDQSGTLATIKRHDYLPFGEELFAPAGGRSAANGYGCPPTEQGCTGDKVRQQFTQKERDIETGLDYFGARYYSSTQGRFTSPDPFSIIQMRQSAPNDAKTHSAFMQFIGDPRRWNRFAYAINSPLVFTDKTGLDIMIIENGATKGNPIGHTAIAITGRGVYSMGNAEKTDRHRDNKNNIIGGGVKDYIDREGPRRNTTITIIKTTLEQDAAVEKSMVEQARDKPKLESGIKITVADNCSTRVNEALDAAGGINSPFEPPPASMPGSAGFRAIGSGLEYQVIQVPQGSNYGSLTDADKAKLREFEPIEDRKMKPEKP